MWTPEYTVEAPCIFMGLKNFGFLLVSRYETVVARAPSYISMIIIACLWSRFLNGMCRGFHVLSYMPNWNRKLQRWLLNVQVKWPKGGSNGAGEIHVERVKRTGKSYHCPTPMLAYCVLSLPTISKACTLLSWTSISTKTRLYSCICSLPSLIIRLHVCKREYEYKSVVETYIKLVKFLRSRFESTSALRFELLCD